MYRKNRLRKLINLDLKKEIITKRESGKSLVHLSNEYGLAKSTIATILKKKEEIKNAQVAKGISRLSSARCNITEQMETLLLVWINEKKKLDEKMSDTVICEKARALFKELRDKDPTTSTPIKKFFGTKGWFLGFKMRTGLYSNGRHYEASIEDEEHSEASNGDEDESGKHIEEFNKLIEEGGFVPQQVFNCDETAFFWKNMPGRTYIQKQPDNKLKKDQISLLFCANASGDCKIKPLLVHHSENPRGSENIMENDLGVMWRSNHDALITTTLFSNWITEEFGPSVREYLRMKELPVKVLLVMDNAPAHPPYLIEELPVEFRFIKVHFLPPKVTYLLQPMKQQVIRKFKEFYNKALLRKYFGAGSSSDINSEDFWEKHFHIEDAVFLIVVAWEEISVMVLNLSWKSLWPDAVPIRDSAMVQQVKTEPMVPEIVYMDFSNESEFKNEDEEINEEEEEIRSIPASELTEMFTCWNKVSGLMKSYHPDIAAVEVGLNQFNNNLMAHFWNVLEARIKKSTSDSNLKIVDKHSLTDKKKYTKSKSARKSRDDKSFTSI